MIAAGLDRVDKLKPRSGQVDLFGFGRGDLDGGVAGGGIKYEHHIDGSLSAWGQGTAGMGWGDQRGLSYEALAGLRWRF